MNRDELADLLESHTAVLAAQGIPVQIPEVAPPATDAQVDALQAELGVVLPESFRSTLTTLSAAVSWSWSAEDHTPFPEPFDEIHTGHLEWSIDTIVDCDRSRTDLMESTFGEPGNYFEASWEDKLAFQHVGNADLLAIDLDPRRAGAVVYLSHEVGEGHGYVLAHSLIDLVDRWAPLGCPGASDEQWLQFVPWDEGPIDPTCAMARQWIDLLGLRDDPPRTPPTIPTPEHIDALLEQFRRSPTSGEGTHAARRAIKCCGPDRVADILDLLQVDDPEIQPLAASRLGALQASEAVPALAEAARRAHPYLREVVVDALHDIPGPEAEAAIRQLEAEEGGI